jgi:hydrogenase nickel incorporation protein HypA/HybF
MHELSIAQAIVEQAEAAAARQQARRIRRIEIEVGSLSGVEPYALETAFPVAAEDGVADGAELKIHPVPAEAHCRACGTTFRPEDIFFVCPECASPEVDIVKGRELNIRSIEIDVEPSGKE